MKRYYLTGSIVLILTIVIFKSFYNHYIQKNYQFNGTVQKVTYKSFVYHPTITVNNHQYDLEYIRWFDDADSLQVGDSVIKNRDTIMMLVIQKKHKRH
jgi:hypothetical protein